MKVSKRTRSYPKFRGWKVPTLDRGPEVETFNQLPPRGHPAYGYFVKDIKEWYRWEKTKGRWVKVGFAAWRVRPIARNLKELEVQPMFKHVVNLPIVSIINVSDDVVFASSLKSVIKALPEENPNDPHDLQAMYSLQGIRDRIGGEDPKDFTKYNEGVIKNILDDVAKSGKV